MLTLRMDFLKSRCWQEQGEQRMADSQALLNVLARGLMKTTFQLKNMLYVAVYKTKFIAFWSNVEL